MIKRCTLVTLACAVQVISWGDKMKIRLRYFGFKTIDLAQYMELPEGSSIADLVHLLQKNHELNIEQIPTTTFLVNNSRAEKNTVLNDGDEVLILQTLGGG